jgi:hypothetical protein
MLRGTAGSAAGTLPMSISPAVAICGDLSRFRRVVSARCSVRTADATFSAVEIFDKFAHELQPLRAAQLGRALVARVEQRRAPELITFGKAERDIIDALLAHGTFVGATGQGQNGAHQQESTAADEREIDRRVRHGPASKQTTCRRLESIKTGAAECRSPHEAGRFSNR